MIVNCIYHANCFDGIAAAWCVKHLYPNAFIMPLNYGEDYRGKIFPLLDYPQEIRMNPIEFLLLMVDFSVPRELMIEIKSMCNFIVLDHHKTAQKDCEGLSFCNFDMNRSGAGLTWDYLFPLLDRPNFINYVEDRDLWKFAMFKSRAVNAYLQSYPQTIEGCKELHQKTNSSYKMGSVITAGEAILRYQQQLAERICENYYIVEIAGYKAAIVNSCPILMGEVGEILTKIPGVDFGAYYFDRKDGIRQWGARSIGDFDVSIIAKQFGGGGHKNAAGWQVNLNKLGITIGVSND